VKCVTPGVIELPTLTLSDSENEVTFDISGIQDTLNTGATLETELLTEEDKWSYAEALDAFYRSANILCHVATLSPDMALAEWCPTTVVEPVEERRLQDWSLLMAPRLQQWRSAISYLSGIAQGVRPDSDAAASYAAFVQARVLFLIVSGRSMIMTSVKDLQGIMEGRAPMAKPLPIGFEGCNFPKVASGYQLSRVCLSALPVPPLKVSTKDGKLVLIRQTNGGASVIVQLNMRLPKATIATPVANLPVQLKPLCDLPAPQDRT
jgi:hypothetical protein